MIAIATRTAEILRGAAKESINMVSTGPMKVTMRYPKGREEKTEVNNIDESITNLFMRVDDFEIRVPVETSFVIFRYNEKEHYSRSIEARIECPFRESMDKYAAGFVLLKDVITADLIFLRVKTQATRLLGLVRKVAKKFLGDAYSEDFREIRVQQFRSDRIYFNIFGFIFSIRTRWED